MTTHHQVKKQPLSLDVLNEIFEPLHYSKRIEMIYKYFDSKEVLFSSSFGTRSVFLIHLIHKICPDQKIYFIDTTYHFPETIHYKHLLTEKYSLKVKDVFPDPIQNALTTEEQWWQDHPNMCCTVNKISPLEDIINHHKVWISGLMAFQTKHRARLRIFERQGDIIKFHPLIDIPEEEYSFRKGFHNLPSHPLEIQGYGSVGCMHCTSQGEFRSGRWGARGKTECGLHTNFFFKK